MLLLLSIPKPWLLNDNQSQIIRTVSVDLSPPATKPENKKTPSEPVQIKEPVKQVIQKTDQALNTPTLQQTSAINKSTLPQNKKAQAKQKTPINSSDVQMMMSKVVDPRILDSTFSAQRNQNQFIAKQFIATDKYGDLPYLDESVDAPRVHMEFYSEGFMGNVEKFFDKITYKKTFTTKYGTKIHCALIGVIAMCGWK